MFRRGNLFQICDSFQGILPPSPFVISLSQGFITGCYGDKTVTIKAKYIKNISFEFVSTMEMTFVVAINHHSLKKKGVKAI